MSHPDGIVSNSNSTNPPTVYNHTTAMSSRGPTTTIMCGPPPRRSILLGLTSSMMASTTMRQSSYGRYGREITLQYDAGNLPIFHPGAFLTTGFLASSFGNVGVRNVNINQYTTTSATSRVNTTTMKNTKNPSSMSIGILNTPSPSMRDAYHANTATIPSLQEEEEEEEEVEDSPRGHLESSIFKDEKSNPNLQRLLPSMTTKLGDKYNNGEPSSTSMIVPRKPSLLPPPPSSTGRKNHHHKKSSRNKIQLPKNKSSKETSSSSPPSTPPQNNKTTPPPFRVCECFPGDENIGYLYTVGLHDFGVPEFFACGIQTSRVPQVERNMIFLGLSILSGGEKKAVQDGHLSTDTDYRVQVVKVEHEEFRMATIDHYLHEMDPEAQIMELIPFYTDATKDSWGSFPPAPHGETERRDNIMNAILFHSNDSKMCPSSLSLSSTPTKPIEFNWKDAAFVFHNIFYFARLLLVQRRDDVIDRLPNELRLIFHQYSILYREWMRTNATATAITAMVQTRAAATSSSSSSSTTTTTNTTMMKGGPRNNNISKKKKISSHNHIHPPSTKKRRKENPEKRTVDPTSPKVGVVDSPTATGVLTGVVGPPSLSKDPQQKPIDPPGDHEDSDMKSVTETILMKEETTTFTRTTSTTTMMMTTTTTTTTTTKENRKEISSSSSSSSPTSPEQKDRVSVTNKKDD